MKAMAGLWIDHRKAVITLVSDDGEKTTEIRSNAEKQPGRIEGVRSTAGIITGAALIMVAVFAGFAAGQLVMFQEIGFGLGVAVLLDATLIRTMLLPATMRLLGEWNWYLPPFLRWLPRIQIEGVAVWEDGPDPAPEQGEGEAVAGCVHGRVCLREPKLVEFLPYRSGSGWRVRLAA